MLADTSEQWSICVYLCLLSMHDEYSVEFMFGCLALARNSPASQTTKLYTQYILYNYIILTDKHMVIRVRLWACIACSRNSNRLHAIFIVMVLEEMLKSVSYLTVH